MDTIGELRFVLYKEVFLKSNACLILFRLMSIIYIYIYAIQGYGVL